ncbi:hypothetical protein ANCDUO_11457 [Ancylostoma duodenale]|uniref:Chondroitin proteoglycan 4 domain-containing protein n=1 Tax=Ancylostoma duodenale TaxID=51022 RepID=A0A0C2D833_9BILA|nr:hypothetical protein ANCDUO_11457 [Ancylostoma duodenale]
MLIFFVCAAVVPLVSPQVPIFIGEEYYREDHLTLCFQPHPEFNETDVASPVILAAPTECGPVEQAKVRQCADPLYRKDAITERGVNWTTLLTRTKEYFSEVCDDCIYPEMLRNFDCFTKTLTRAEMMQCQAEMISDTRNIPKINDFNNTLREAAVCGAMRSYIDCVRYPVRYECGYRAWIIVREVIIRPVHAFLPECQLKASPNKWRFSLLSFVLLLLCYLF